MKYTIRAKTEHRLKIQRSEFIGFLFPVQSMDEVQEILKEHQQAYADATHNCYGYILGYKGETSYYSDAGEPSGTAGKPILNVLLRNELSGVLAIVTRYYGGIKLGVKGLIDAYTQSTAETLEKARLCQYQELFSYEVQTEYPLLESLRHRFQGLKIKETDAEYSEQVVLKLSVPDSAREELEEILNSYTAQNRLSYSMEK